MSEPKVLTDKEIAYMKRFNYTWDALTSSEQCVLNLLATLDAANERVERKKESVRVFAGFLTAAGDEIKLLKESKLLQLEATLKLADRITELEDGLMKIVKLRNPDMNTFEGFYRAFNIAEELLEDK